MDIHYAFQAYLLWTLAIEWCTHWVIGGVVHNLFVMSFCWIQWIHNQKPFEEPNNKCSTVLFKLPSHLGQYIYLLNKKNPNNNVNSFDVIECSLILESKSLPTGWNWWKQWQSEKTTTQRTLGKKSTSVSWFRHRAAPTLSCQLRREFSPHNNSTLSLQFFLFKREPDWMCD